MFHQGYGAAAIDSAEIAYHRYARIVEDIALFCEEVLDGSKGPGDRAQSLRHLTASFDPNGTIAIAHAEDGERADP